MSHSTNRRPRGTLQRHARVFAALGDPTRAALIEKLAAGPAMSIARLTEGQRLTRQAISKHLRILTHAGLVRSVRRGRENRFAYRPEALDDARCSLDQISRQWDDALERLKAFVERDPVL